MKKNIIYNKSATNMSELENESIDMMVTSPPYNINIKYGNDWDKRKIVKSKGSKYKDDLEESEYRLMLSDVFKETKRALKQTGTIFLNLKNRYINKQLLPPFWALDYFQDMFLKNVIIWNFDWGGSTEKRFSSRYEYVFMFTKNNLGFKKYLKALLFSSFNPSISS